MKTELIWKGKYDGYGNMRAVDIAGCAMAQNNGTKTLKVVLVIYAIVSLVYGLCYLLIPGVMVAMSGGSPVDLGWLRWPGGILIALCAMPYAPCSMRSAGHNRPHCFRPALVESTKGKRDSVS